MSRGFNQQSTFLRENVPLSQTPHGKTQYIGGTSLPSSYPGTLGGSSVASVRQIVVDLSVDRSGNNPPLVIPITGNLIAFTESYNAGSPSSNDLMSITLLNSASPGINDPIDFRPGRGIENFPFDSISIKNSPQAGSTRALLIVISSPSSEVITNG